MHRDKEIPVEPLWRDLEADLQRRTRRIAAGALPYPLIVVAAAAGGAILLNRTYPGLVTGRILLRDLWWAVTGSGIVAVPLIARYRRMRGKILWYHGMARICTGLERGAGLVYAVERAALETPPAMESLLMEFVRECSAGGAPDQALSVRGCPAELVRSFTTTTGEIETARKIRKELGRYAEVLRARFEMLERLAPAVTTAAGGTILLWLVVRVVLPVLAELTTGGLYE